MRKCCPATLAAVLFLSVACRSWGGEAGPVYKRIGPFDLLGSGPHYLDAGVGLFDVFDTHEMRALAGKVELRIGKKLAFVGPAIGVLATGDGSRYGYAGIYADFSYGKFVLTPLLGVGAYHRGNGIDLGGSFEFRESLEIAYRIGDRWRAGISIAHVSNANIYESNPGQQDLLLTIAAGF